MPVSLRGWRWLGVVVVINLVISLFVLWLKSSDRREAETIAQYQWEITRIDKMRLPEYSTKGIVVYYRNISQQAPGRLLHLIIPVTVGDPEYLLIWQMRIDQVNRFTVRDQPLAIRGKTGYVRWLRLMSLDSALKA